MKTINILFILAAVLIAVACKEKPTTPVEKFGQLSVDGVHIVDKSGDPVQLAGMSFFWSQWIDKYYNYETVKWLKDDWKCSIVRAAMAVEHGGYVSHPDTEWEKVTAVVDAAIDLGLYVIVDFHSHRAEQYQNEAVEFFGKLAQKYGQYPNIIYEIYNEPLNVSWSEVLKPYSEAVITAIREHDTNNIIACGTPRWSQLVNEAANDPIEGDNIAYVLHFYAGTHGNELMEIGDEAIEKGLCLIVTEYGTTEANGDGDVYVDETKAWYAWMDRHKISHCNWSIADKDEASAALVSGAHPQGGWPEDMIKPSAKLVRSELLKKHEEMFGQ
jgi:endoglucanase